MDITDYVKAEIESAEIQATKYQSYGHACRVISLLVWIY